MAGRYQHEKHSTVVSLSASFSASLSLSEAIDLDIVDEIISRARDATTFAQTQYAYNQVLKERGIRPSDDKLYYQFMLKLSMVRAATWGERWDVWRSMHDETRASSVKAVSSTARQTGINPLKSRVPFLASASSDLDEGFADESGAESEVAPHRESPRKNLRKTLESFRGHSLVGYTPSHSGEEDSFDLVGLPARTSTPRKARKSANHHIHDGFRKSLDDRHRDATSPTPPTYEESITYSTIHPDRTLDLTPKVADDVPYIDSRQLRDLEFKGNQFLRLGLMGRCFSTWYQSADWIWSTSNKIEEVRNMLLVRQHLQKWREALDISLSRPATADAHFQLATERNLIDKWLKLVRERRRDRRLLESEQSLCRTRDNAILHRTWKSWRERLIRKRTKRWEQDLRRREKLATQRFQSAKLERLFHQWHDQAREGKADAHFVRTTLDRTFGDWLAFALQSRDLNNRLAGFKRRQGIALVRGAMTKWRKTASLIPLEEMAVQQRNRDTLHRHMSFWMKRMDQARLADAFNDRIRMRAAMSRMGQALQKRVARERMAHEIVAARDREVLTKAIHVWSLVGRSRLYDRVTERRQKRSLFAKWLNKADRVLDMEAQVAQFTAASDLRRKHSALNRWRDVIGSKRNTALKADLMFVMRAKSSLLTKWKHVHAKQADNAATADKAHAFFTLRATFKIWKTARTTRQRQAFTERLRLNNLRTVMNSWREATFQSLEDKVKVETFQQEQAKRYIAMRLDQWTQRVIAIKSDEIVVTERYNRSLVRKAFGKWTRKLERARDLDALLESALDIRAEEQLRSAFRGWRQRADYERNLRQRFELFAAERRERTLSLAMVKWVGLKRERDLRATEEEVALRHEDALMFAVYDRWIARTSSFDAIRFDCRRMRRNTLDRWQRALVRVREEKRAAAEHDSRLKEDAFGVWRKAYLAKMVKKRTHHRRRRGASPALIEGRRGSSPRFGHAAQVPRHSLPGVGSTETPSRQRVAPGPRPSLPTGSSSRSILPRHSQTRVVSGTSGSSKSETGSVASEPAYSRLKGELSTPNVDRTSRGRSASDEDQVRVRSKSNDRTKRPLETPMSELVRALREAKRA